MKLETQMVKSETWTDKNLVFQTGWCKVVETSQKIWKKNLFREIESWLNTQQKEDNKQMDQWETFQNFHKEKRDMWRSEDFKNQTFKAQKKGKDKSIKAMETKGKVIHTTNYTRVEEH